MTHGRAVPHRAPVSDAGPWRETEKRRSGAGMHGDPVQPGRADGDRALKSAWTWSELLARHPVLRRAHQMGFAELEKQNLVRHLAATGLFGPEEICALNAPGERSMVDLMGMSMRVAGLLEQIAQIEAGLSDGQRQGMLDAAYAFLQDATGLPAGRISGLFSEVRWTSGRLAEVLAGGGMTSPQRQVQPTDVQKPENRRLLALVAKRITHDLIIHGKSLRYFYQALPLLRETIDGAYPGLTNLYIGFGASLQLMMLLYDGPFLEGAAIRAGRVESQIQNGAFQIRIMGINFPSLFNEMVKGLFEALLHPGMPTKEQLGENEIAFRELTGGPDLEYALMKVAPEVAGRLHQALLGIATRHRVEIGSALRRAGHGDMPDAGYVSMLLRAFSQLDPRSTLVCAGWAIKQPLTKRQERHLVAQLLPHLES